MTITRYWRHLGAVLAVGLLTALAVPIAAASAQDLRKDLPSTTYLVTIENLSNQPFTPPVFAAHSNPAGFFEVGDAASPGLQGVAENGDVPGLVTELQSNPRVGEVVVRDEGGPLLGGQSITFELDLHYQDRFLSFASMLICTNDGFVGLDSLNLPTAPGRTQTVDLMGYDAGTEINTEAFADIVPPCGPLSGVDSAGQGTGASNPALAENGVITMHPGIAGSSDLDPAIVGWDEPAARLQVTRIDRTKKFEIEVANNTAGQPLTPPVLVGSGWFYNLFDTGAAASAGIQGLAENGDVPGLVGEISNDFRVYNTVVGNGPVLPGETQTITVYVSQWTNKISFASMLICTNDGFTGVNSMRVPNTVGDSRIFEAAAYDAGTELNTEAFADIVPPCGPLSGVDSAGQGTGASNPALAENGVITMHPGIGGSSDLSTSVHDWTDAPATVTITRVG